MTSDQTTGDCLSQFFFTTVWHKVWPWRWWHDQVSNIYVQDPFKWKISESIHPSDWEGRGKKLWEITPFLSQARQARTEGNFGYCIIHFITHFIRIYQREGQVHTEIRELPTLSYGRCMQIMGVVQWTGLWGILGINIAYRDTNSYRGKLS